MISEEAPARAVKLRQLIEGAVARRPADTILLSGGLDTSVLATVARPDGLRLAVTVLVGRDAPDEPFARTVAERLGLVHHVVRVDLDQLLEEVPFLVKTLGTFQPLAERKGVPIAHRLSDAAR